MVAVLTAEQFQYTDSGIVLNSSVSLPFVDIESIQGLDNAPVRASQVDREGDDGGYVDSEFESLRTVTLEGTVYADPNNVETYLDSLKANYAPTRAVQALYFGTDAGTRVVFGKSQGFKYDKNQLRRLGMAAFQVQVICEDSRIYSPTVSSASVSLVSSAITGRGYNKSYNFGYGVAATTNALALTLTGNRPSPGVLTITGACQNPTIINDTSGTEMDFSITLASGDVLTIDLGTKAVILNGTANRRSTLTITGPWFKIVPGINSFRFLGTQTPPTPVATLTVAAKPAYR